MSAICDEPNEQMLIPDVLAKWPQARVVLDRYGLRGCGGARGPVESLAFFARAHDVPLARLLGELKSSLDQRGGLALAQAIPSVGDTNYRPFFLAGIGTVL